MFKRIWCWLSPRQDYIDALENSLEVAESHREHWYEAYEAMSITNAKLIEENRCLREDVALLTGIRLAQAAMIQNLSRRNRKFAKRLGYSDTIQVDQKLTEGVQP